MSAEDLLETAEFLRETADEMEAAGRPAESVTTVREGAAAAEARAARVKRDRERLS
jgi:hypothetical protein